MRTKELIKMKRVYNGEEFAITVVSDGNEDVVIEPGETVEIDLTDEHHFNDDSFYVQEEGEWYAKEADHYGGRIEIYNAGK